ncbi:MAG: bifunctional chorismate mutase/prephenate dehydrogenase [Phycisphaerales bacterium]|nr:bifunctional chorismate mutase/prephenate dehydrogenase [Phycisphaerales bacterium]
MPRDEPPAPNPDSPLIPPALQRLRDGIDEVDRSIVDLLAKRHALIAEVAAVKRTTGVPIKDPGREASLLEARRSQATVDGLSPDMVEGLFRLLLRSSRDRQASLRAAVPEDLRLCTVAIIGAGGGMGQLWTRLMETVGHEVLAVDLDTTLSSTDAAAEADVVLVAVPIDVTETVIKQVAPAMGPDALLTDITSVKAGPTSAMMEHFSGSVIGTHPLFGPSVRSLQNQRLAFVPARDVDGHWTKWLRTTYQSLGLTLLDTQADTHDRIMSVVQVLTHHATEVMGRAMLRLGVPVEETLRFTSPVYRMELLMTARHFAQDADLYRAIEAGNPNCEAVTEAVRSSAEEFSTVLASGDVEEFRSMFTQVTDFFGEFAPVALEQSSALIERLVEMD